MRQVKVLRTPEDVLAHKAAKYGSSVKVAPADPAPADPAPADPAPADPAPADPASSEDLAPADPASSEDLAPADPASSEDPTDEAKIAALVEELKDKNTASELDVMAESLGLDVKGNKTDVATAIVKKQLGIEE